MLNKRILVLMFVVAFLFVGCMPSVTPPVTENQAPTITSVHIPTTATVGVAYTYDVEATDPDGDTLTYSLTANPPGMTINSATGVIKWTPYSTQVGNNAVKVEVSDGTLSDTQSFTILVSKTEEEEYVGGGGGYVPVTVTDVTLDETFMMLRAGGATGTLVATVAPANATNKNVTWDSSNDLVATVDAGVVTPLTVGTAIITVETVDGGFTATCKVKVLKVTPVPAPVKLTKIVVDPKTMELFVGQTITGDILDDYSITAYYNDESTKDIDFDRCGYDFTAAAEILDFSDLNNVTAVAEGTAIIVVSYTEGTITKTDEWEFTVIEAELTGIEVDPKPMTLFVGEIEFFKVIAHYNYGPTKNVTYDCVYVSNDTNIAKVLLIGPNDYQKSVKAVGEGTAKITATYKDMKDTLVVTVPLKVGDIGPAGGLIFYDKGSYSDGWRYLEAAPSDQSGPYHAWSNIIDVEIGTSAQGTAIGTGQTNTTAIIGQTGHTESAAKLCEDFSITNDSTIYNDWFLPSQDELNLMFTNLCLEGLGGFANCPYWSSSELDAISAWDQYFNPNYGHQCYTNKCHIRGVRAVRAF